MRYTSWAARLALILVLLLSACSLQKSDSRPNIIYILADDLGYGELGCYGQQKIKTPNIDQLAAGGMKFTQHYAAAPVCAPSRCAILTGLHMGHAYVRGNDEWNERGDVWNFEAMEADPNLEGQRPLPDGPTLGSVLQSAGYKTALVGKWGLGGPQSEGVPNNRGFDFFFGYNCQRQAHMLYPKHVWRNREKVELNNSLVPPGTKLDSAADPYDPQSYARFNQNDYAPKLMQDEALRFMEENKDRPFMLYYATPIPHMPLQAPLDWVQAYVEEWGEEEPYLGNKGYYPNRYPHATYAAMISYLDQQVGEIVQKVRELGLEENTLIIFTSDNGPTYNGGTDSPFFDSAQPFKSEYGWGKGFVHEGGIRVPMIAYWKGKIAAGSTSDLISFFPDMLPTLAEVANAEAPPGLDGISFLPELLGKRKDQKQHEYLYWEFPEYKGQQAVRMGKWKGIRKNLHEGKLAVELYDLETDPREQQDVADAHPEIIKQIEALMLKEHDVSTQDAFRIKVLDSLKKAR